MNHRGAATRGVKRSARIAKDVHRLLGEALTFQVRDPRLEGVVITNVVVTDDLKLAKINWTLLSGRDPRHILEAEGGFEKARGLFRRLLGSELELKSVPELKFYYDTGLEHSRHIETLLATTATARTSEPDAPSHDPER